MCGQVIEGRQNCLWECFQSNNFGNIANVLKDSKTHFRIFILQKRQKFRYDLFGCVFLTYQGAQLYQALRKSIYLSKYYTSNIHLGVCRNGPKSRQYFGYDVILLQELTDSCQLDWSDAPDLWFQIVEIFCEEWQEDGLEQLSVHYFSQLPHPGNQFIPDSPAKLITNEVEVWLQGCLLFLRHSMAYIFCQLDQRINQIDLVRLFFVFEQNIHNFHSGCLVKSNELHQIFWVFCCIFPGNKCLFTGCLQVNADNRERRYFRSYVWLTGFTTLRMRQMSRQRACLVSL